MNVIAKIARKTLVLEISNVEIKISELNLPVKAIYELPFTVTVENRLGCFQ